MAGLGDLFKRARASKGHLRAKHLAKADYTLMRDLVRVRIDSGLTQADVAQMLGLSQQAVSKFEQYDSDPKLSTVRRYAHVVGALVAHVVEVDNGQLERGNWTAVAFSVPTVKRVASVTYAADGVKRSDFAVAA